MKFPHYFQLDAMDCGPTCLRMIASYYGRNIPMQKLRTSAQIGKDGVNMLGIAHAAEIVGFKTMGVKSSMDNLINKAPLPCIVHWGQSHFVVLVCKESARKSIFRGSLNNASQLIIADPAGGLISVTPQEFQSKWASNVGKDGQAEGVALFLEPTEKFYSDSIHIPPSSAKELGIFYRQLVKYKGLIFQIALGLTAGAILQLLIPLLTKTMVDIGIQTKNLHFVYLVLGAQMALMVGRMSVEFIRSWIILHISTRVNLSILTEFLAKLLRLPIGYFDSKTLGDVIQRIGDNRRIEQFLTGTSINVMFSIFNILLYSLLIAYYHLVIYGVFILGSILYAFWIILFLRERRSLNNRQFALGSQNHNNIIQLISSVPELKLNNAEIKKRWEWENLQVKNFHLSMSGLTVQQYQQAGALFINEGKNITVTFLAAMAVINGELTLGGMMALLAIMGQMNGPVEQLVLFIQQWQDAQISLERLNEIHDMEDENDVVNGSDMVGDQQGIVIKNLSFAYSGAGNELVLKNLNLTLPRGKVTAIVGSSGSGKTTLLKLLLQFYRPHSGEIAFPISNVDGQPLSKLRELRAKCGTVLQDGYIFSDTIANNIAVSDETPDYLKILHAVKVANLEGFVTSLPMGLNTRIGMDGNGISQGQRQRILIARAVYKDPEYLFFDEATNALDTENEAIIMSNLTTFFTRKTVVVVAHRLSTVRNADQIVVLEKGQIVERGKHEELIMLHGRYFQLVSNQLELAI